MTIEQLETRLQVLENRELGKSAGSTKGKPKIEVYEKDRKKGAGALTTPAKVSSVMTYDILLSMKKNLRRLSDNECVGLKTCPALQEIYGWAEICSALQEICLSEPWNVLVLDCFSFLP